jgi:histidinol phosphatase-like PHP family hydrolase
MKVKKLYHLHTIACNHATLTLDEMVEYSLKNGYEKLIFTEHYPYPNSDETDE